MGRGRQRVAGPARTAMSATGLRPAPIQTLSEVERAGLRRVALFHLERRQLDFKIVIPVEMCKRKKSLRRKFDSFSKERESAPKAFGIPLSQVIANDRALRRRRDVVKASRRDCLELESSVLRFRAEKRQEPSENPEHRRHGERRGGLRRGGLSVDSISELVDSQSRLLEALQLSHPAELDPKRGGGGTRGGQGGLSLNPLCRQVPRVLERCCRHIEAHGLRTVGVFRVGSSRKRVRQLREDFDGGLDVDLEREQSVHDVAALLKEFLRDLPDPLLSRELYPAFLHANLLRGAEQLRYLQHLLYLLPPCNCDTLLRLLAFLHTVHSCAHDGQIPGNKMTAANLAVVFGPNLLQGEPGGHAEDSATVIAVTLALMQNYRELFTVSAELQREVLLGLIRSDPDIVDYLLRRKLSGARQRMTADGGPGGRRDTGDSLDSAGASGGSPSPEGGLSGELFLGAPEMSRSGECPAGRYGKVRPGKSLEGARRFRSHHNLLGLSGGRSTASGAGEEGKSGFWDLFTGRGSGSEAAV
ncbi:rho GTPase-activating protein 36 isoform X2 [Stigmatopora nigra]